MINSIFNPKFNFQSNPQGTSERISGALLSMYQPYGYGSSILIT
uniref:Uncharacterized protein n=1 Tax=Arundo donax TaxID=35708 RepID=A0A0A8YMM3_ARUDO